MRTRFRILAATGLLLTLGLSGSSVAGAQELSGDAQRVVDYLLDDWAKQFRSTSIPLAMDNLAVEPDDALRLEIGRHFREHTDLARNLRFWGANNYIFTNEEKRLAKFLIQAHETSEHLLLVRRLMRWGSPRRVCESDWGSWRRPGSSSQTPVRSWASHWLTGMSRGVGRCGTITIQ